CFRSAWARKAPHSGALQNLRKNERRRNFAKRFGVRRSAPLLEPKRREPDEGLVVSEVLGRKKAPHSGALQNLRKSESRRNFAKRFGVRRSAPFLEPNDRLPINASSCRR